MRKLLIITFAALSLGMAAAAAAQDEPVPFDGNRARIYKSAPGRTLTAPSKAAPASVVGGFLSSHGVGASTRASLHAVEQYQNRVSGLTHVRMEQQVAGLRVVDAYVKAAINTRGELVHLIQNIAPVRSTTMAPARGIDLGTGTGNAPASVHCLKPIHHSCQIFADGLITARRLSQRPESIFSVVDRSQHSGAQQLGQLARIHLVALAALL